MCRRGLSSRHERPLPVPRVLAVHPLVRGHHPDRPSRGGGQERLPGRDARTSDPRNGIRIPNGFALTAEAYRRLLNLGGLEQRIRSRLRGLDTREVQALQRAGHNILNAILETPFPAHIEEAILAAHDQLQRSLSSELRVAVQSSATTEDLPEASFAGQQKTFLNLPGGAALIDASYSLDTRNGGWP